MFYYQYFLFMNFSPFTNALTTGSYDIFLTVG